MTLKILKLKFLQRLWLKMRPHFYDQRVKDTAIVQNINYSELIINQKKAVICYLTTSYINDWGNNNIGRTQPKEILAMVKALSDLNYCIDLIGYHDLRALPYLKKKKYHLVFGFGESFYQLTNLHPSAISILYMTEHHPNFAEKAERNRLDYFYQRHGKRGKFVRSGNFYWQRHLQKKYTHLLTMSEIAPFAEQYSEPFSIFPTGVHNTDFVLKKKDCNNTRKQFLWLGSYGAIHKGLDLLLEVFDKREDLTLHIGGFYKADRKLIKLPKKPNIIDHDYIDVKSQIFLDIVDDCSFLILPSCSEGFSTAVTTGMLHGLIPIVVKDTGMNRLGDLAIFLEDYKLEYLDKKLIEISSLNPDILERLSERCYDFAHRNFVPKEFERSFKKVMNQIINISKNA